MAQIVFEPSATPTPVPAAMTTFAVTGIGMAAAIVATLEWQGSPITVALLAFAIATALTWHALPAHGPRPFGWANVVTTGRLAATCYVAAALLAAARDHDVTSVWIAVGVTFVALASDGIDGYLARRSGLASPFGARFDMEVDAALILLLSIAAWELGKAGGWIVLIGAMRYAFVAAAQVVPRLRAPLPTSFARKAVCVIQVSALCIAVMPVVPPQVSSVLAGVALVALLWSFGRDTLFLLRQTDQPS